MEIIDIKNGFEDFEIMVVVLEIVGNLDVMFKYKYNKKVIVFYN